MIEKALKRDFLPSPLGALLPITVQNPLFNLTLHIAYHFLESPYNFQKIFPIHPFDIFPKTTKVRKLDSPPTQSPHTPV